MLHFVTEYEVVAVEAGADRDVVGRSLTSFVVTILVMLCDVLCIRNNEGWPASSSRRGVVRSPQ
jgi:hypothetical protein